MPQTVEERKAAKLRANRKWAAMRPGYYHDYHMAHRERICRRSRKWHADHLDRAHENHRKYKYGKDIVEKYNQLLVAQNGVCAACGGNRSKQALCIDHNHTTGITRGLLCRKCNLALGHMEDNSKWLQNLTDYAKKHEVSK